MKLEFLSFDTQHYWDSDTIQDNSATLLGTISGQYLPSDIFSDSDTLISFQSNSYYTRTGFSIKYAALENSCGK